MSEYGTFGPMLRVARCASGKTLGETARHLGISTPYLSDVERGLRRPFRQDRVRDVAAFLGADAGPLLAAALTHNRTVRLPPGAVVVTDTPETRETVARAMAAFNCLPFAEPYRAAYEQGAAAVLAAMGVKRA